MPIPKPYLLIQLMVNDRTAWQVKTEIDPKLCRKMTTEELEDLGHTLANDLGAIITNPQVDAEPAFKKFAAADGSKKRR